MPLKVMSLSQETVDTIDKQLNRHFICLQLGTKEFFTINKVHFGQVMMKFAERGIVSIYK